MVDGRLGQDAVAEVEDVAGPAAGLLEDAPSLPLDLGRTAKRTTGSRLPWTATCEPRRLQARSRSTRQSRPMTVPPGVALELEQGPCRCRSGSSAPPDRARRRAGPCAAGRIWR